jgi:DNA polymerase (family 10)
VETLDPSTPFITNPEVARILFQIASLLEMTQDNIYRVRAYRRAALGVLLLPQPLVAYYARGEEPPLPGVGVRIRGRLRELMDTGQMGVYETLLDEVGDPIASLLSLNGVGPKTATRLVTELEIASLSDLVHAAKAGKVQKLRGFGARREEALRLAAEERVACGAA